MQRHCYLTKRVYNQHPVGSKCFAFRIDGGSKLALEFMDGDVIELSGVVVDEIKDNPWAPSIEDDLISLWYEDIRQLSDNEPMNEIIMEFKRESLMNETKKE